MSETLISKPCLTEGMELVHMSSKGQIVIPLQVRKHLKLTRGSRLVLVEQKGMVVLRKEDDDTILTPADKRAIDRARRDIREGKGITLDQLEKELGYR